MQTLLYRMGKRQQGPAVQRVEAQRTRGECVCAPESLCNALGTDTIVNRLYFSEKRTKAPKGPRRSARGGTSQLPRQSSARVPGRLSQQSLCYQGLVRMCALILVYTHVFSTSV